MAKKKNTASHFAVMDLFSELNGIGLFWVSLFKKKALEILTTHF
jgi:hypothetical protein